jgi:acyl dehydratase
MTAPVQIGDEIIAADFGPLTIVDTVRWSGVQENAERIHWDREFAREHSGLRTFIASGGFRQALLARALTDWLGLRGRLRKLRVRHTRPTFEGDTIRYNARVTKVSHGIAGTSISCDIEGKNENQEQVLTGSCIMLVTSESTRNRMAIGTTRHN